MRILKRFRRRTWEGSVQIRRLLRVLVVEVVVLAVLVVVGRVDMVGILRIPPMAVKVRTMEDIRR